MVLSIDCSVKDHIEAFMEYLKKRAVDKIHAKNGDVIADFIQYFIVVELKRLGEKDEYFPSDVELPDNLFLDPLKEAKKKMDDIFSGFFQPTGTVPSKKTSETPAPVVTPVSAPAADPAATPKRSGNGHARNKVRSLLDGEKDSIRTEFLSLNGQIDEDACVRLKLNKMPPEVSIFQVTGFVTYLHLKVAGGELNVRDLPAYLAFLQTHRDMWARYNSQKYIDMRATIKKAA
jgi:hypothetical protein